MAERISRALLPDNTSVADDGMAMFGGVRVDDLVAQFGTPLFVYDEDHIRKRCQEAVKAFPDGVSYASKAFLCKAIAKLVHEEGMGLDVATIGEAYVAIQAGMAPDDEKTQVPITLDLDDIKVQKNDKHNNQIKLDDNLMMELKYPSLDQFIKNNFDFDEKNQMEQSFDLIGTCIDKIYNEEEVWATADCTKKEIKEFLESMNSSQFKEIENFFEND